MTISKTIQSLRENYTKSINKPLEKRLKNLRDFYRMIQESEPEIERALSIDLGKSEQESWMTEILLVKNACADAMYSLSCWAKSECADMGRMAVMPDMKGVIEKVPLGTVLVIGAWNYPIQLTLLPVVGAIAGGNVVIIKPSEVATHCSSLIAMMVAKYMDPRVCQVIEGGVQETTEILNQPLDFIFFTGSTAVGKIIYKAAAEKLIPVVLELGGKSPTIIDQTTNLELAATRIMWGKTLNSGQTCIAPDYVLAIGLTESQVEQFASHCKSALSTIFKSSELAECSTYTRIINTIHHTRISKLVAEQKKVAGCKVVQAGSENVATRFFPPTFITGLDMKSTSDPIMSQEIFGPVLPIARVADVDEAVAYHRAVGPTPLALYIFSNDPQTIAALKQGINAGGVVINDTIMHCAIEGLPFGGVGASGLGVYHGADNFHTFTRRQGNLKRSTGLEALSITRYMWFLQGAVLEAVKWLLTINVPSDGVLKVWGWIRAATEPGSFIKYGLVFLLGMYCSRSLVW